MYVFGIDMPIMETLFILMLLTIVAFAIVIWEIRKLRKLIMTEQSDINRFEADINKIESPGGTRQKAGLSKYIKFCIGKGIKKKQIKDSLMKKGWSKKDIKDAFKGS